MKKFLAILCAAILALPVAGCGVKTSEIKYENGAVIFDYYAGDPTVSHSLGEPGSARAWVCDIEEYNPNAAKLANDGVHSEVKSVALPKGNYLFNAQISVSTNTAFVSSTTGSEPTAFVQVLDSAGRVVANEYVMGSVSMVGDDYLSYPLSFELTRAGKYTFRIYNTGRNIVKVSKMTLTATDGVQTFKANPVSAAFLDADGAEAELEYTDGVLYYFDLLSVIKQYSGDYQTQFDLATIVTVLQGIVNRDAQRLFIRFDEGGVETSYPEVDLFWLDYLTNEKKWLPENVVEVKKLDTLLRIFESEIDGLVVWDPLVPATSNVAYTDAGVNDRIPVRFSQNADSVYRRMGKLLPVRLDLNEKFDGRGKIADTDLTSTGSAKNDAYLWASEKYIKTNLTNPYEMACYVDAWVGNDGYMPINYFQANGNQLNDGTDESVPSLWTERIFHYCIVNRDYYVAEKAFFVDLMTFSAHTPIDDRNQAKGLDLETYEKILRASNERAEDKVISMGGFTKWREKYSICVDPLSAGGGGIEGISSMLYTKYNVVWEPDANFSYANASIYRAYPAKAHYENKNSKRMKAEAKKKPLENKNYILVYMGDYDSASWLSRSMPTMFSDPRLGDYPLMWPIIPINETRAPHVYDYMYEKMSDQDVMVGGNNGLGYVYWTNYLVEREGLNGSLAEYVEQTRRMNKKYDIDVMGCYFGGEDFSRLPADTVDTIYSSLADLYPSGVGVWLGSRTIYRQGGAVFTGKDPGKVGKDIMYQSGNQNFLGEGGENDPHHDSVLMHAINTTEAQRPRFHVARSVLCQPGDVFSKVESLQRKYPEYGFELVNPYTFFELYGQYRDNCVEGVYPGITG